MTEAIGIAVVGFGYWGANLARNVDAASTTTLVGIVDPDTARLSVASSLHRDVELWSTMAEALADDRVAAVVLSTPASTHATLALEVIAAGRHVLVEKPLAESIEDAERIADEADAAGVTLMVGHTFLYSAPVARLRAWVRDGELGDVQYIHSKRLSLGRVRRDCNALWNFGPHDVSIMMHLLEERPVEATARGFSFIQEGIDDVCFASLAFPSGVGANLHVSWIDPLKNRTVTVVGNKKMAVFNDVSVDQPLSLVDSGVARDQDLGEYVSLGDFQWRTRAGDTLVPRVAITEPLLEEVTAFGRCCLTGEVPMTDGRHGVDVVRVLVAIDESARRSGAPTEISW